MDSTKEASILSFIIACCKITHAVLFSSSANVECVVDLNQLVLTGLC